MNRQHFMINLSLLLMFLFLSPSVSKPAADYYHDGMGKYIEGRKQQARIEIEEGLGKFPNDEKLNAAKQLLDQLDEQQQDQQDQQSQGGEEEEQEDQEKEDSEGNQDQQDQQEQEEQQAKEEEQEEPQSDSAQGGEQEENEENQEEQQQADAQEVPLGEMSEEEAKRLLDSYKNDEKEDLKNTRKKKGKRGKPQVDW